MFRQKIEKDIEKLITNKDQIDFAMDEARKVLNDAMDPSTTAKFRPPTTNVLLAGILLDRRSNEG